MKFRIFSILLLQLLLLPPVVLAQNLKKANVIWNLSEKAENGDRTSLEELIALSGKRKKIDYFFGRHFKRDHMGSLAVFNLQHICLFPQNRNPYKNTWKDDSQFLKSQLSQLYYDSLAKCWLTDSLNVRKVEYRFSYFLKPIPKEDISFASLQIDSAKIKEFKNLYDQKDPRLMLEIIRIGVRKKRSFFSFDNCTDLVEQLTGGTLEVQDAFGRYSENPYDYDHYCIRLFNYYAFWLQHYKEYHWNETKQCFESSTIVVTPPTEEEIIMTQLSSPDKATAIAAMERLIASDYTIPFQAHLTYKSHPDLGFFWEKMIPPLRKMNHYLNEKGIKAAFTPTQQQLVDSLKLELLSVKRYQLEQRLLKTMDMNSLTALEYHSLLESGNNRLALSTSYIANRFYSENWKEICSDEEQLNLFLKKATVYDAISIQGTSGDLNYKFDQMSPEFQKRLKIIGEQTTDEDIRRNVDFLLKHGPKFNLPLEKPPGKERLGLKFSSPQLDSIVALWLQPDYDFASDKNNKLLDEIDGDLLLVLIQRLPEDFLNRYYGVWDYSLEHYHGMEVSFTDTLQFGKELKRLFAEKNIEDVYIKYLKEYEVAVTLQDGSLNYELLASLLKYEIRDLFIEIYAIKPGLAYVTICLLERKFGTSLGFSGGFFSWEISNTANAIDQTHYWRNFLVEKGLIQQNETPISFIHKHDWKGQNSQVDNEFGKALKRKIRKLKRHSRRRR